VVDLAHVAAAAAAPASHYSHSYLSLSLSLLFLFLFLCCWLVISRDDRSKRVPYTYIPIHTHTYPYHIPAIRGGIDCLRQSRHRHSFRCCAASRSSSAPNGPPPPPPVGRGSRGLVRRGRGRVQCACGCRRLQAHRAEHPGGREQQHRGLLAPGLHVRPVWPALERLQGPRERPQLDRGHGTRRDVL